jgi:hypothetical protein
MLQSETSTLNGRRPEEQEYYRVVTGTRTREKSWDDARRSPTLPIAPHALLRRDMKVVRLPSIRDALALAALLPVFAAVASLPGCELDTPPPASPQNDSTGVSPPPPPPPQGAPQAAAAPAPGDPQYASGEYAVGENPNAYDDNDPSALTDFHGALDPYGTWVDNGTYGTVWVPSQAAVGADFTPYTTAGHWAFDNDWVWASDYPWGWAPFHYGRWVFMDGQGWGWIPGRVYRGAWVGWSVDDGYGYVGWAPMGPEFVWFGGRAVAWNGYVGPRYVYCGRSEVFSATIGTRVLVGPAAARFSGNMRPFVSATPGVTGPVPTRLGYSASQIPRPTGAAAQSITRAQAFSRPSTAVAAGGSPPMHATAATATGSSTVGARPSVTDAQTAPRGTSISTARTPAAAQSSAQSPGARATTTTSAPPMRGAPAYRPSGHSGGHHH